MPKIVNVKGVIVSDDEKWIYDWFGIACTSPQSVMNELSEAGGEDVDVLINSGGGSVFAGSEIYTCLKSYAANVHVKIVGLAASAASVAAMSGNTVAISPTGQLMIHNSWSRASGDYRDMSHTSSVLKNLNISIANAYRLKTNLSEKELLKMMDDETWLTAQQALEKGFVDEIMFDEQKQFAANVNNFSMLPQEVVSKMREFLIANQQQMTTQPQASVEPDPPEQGDPENDEEDEDQQQQDHNQQAEKSALAAALTLLKLKGCGLDE